MKKELMTIVLDSILKENLSTLKKENQMDDSYNEAKSAQVSSKKEKEALSTVNVLEWNGEGGLSHFMRENKVAPENGLLLSENSKHLQEAEKRGMARIGVLRAGSKEFLPGTDTVVEEISDLDDDFFLKCYQREHQIPWTILRTERCVVREFELEDLEALFELYRGEGMTDFMEGLYSYEEEKKYQTAYINYMYRYFGYGMWLVFEKESGKLIGRAGIEHREELGGELELGYAIGVPFQRKGYATEVCKAIMSYVENKLEFQRISCLIEKENEVSVHLAKKLGFAWKEELLIGGKKMQHYIYQFTE